MFKGARCAEVQSVLRSKVCQGVKWVEKESELGCKVYHATLKCSQEAKCSREKSVGQQFLFSVFA